MKRKRPMTEQQALAAAIKFARSLPEGQLRDGIVEACEQERAALDADPIPF